MSTLKDITRKTLIELERLNAQYDKKAIKVKDIDCEWSYQEDFDNLEQSMMQHLENIQDIEFPSYKELLDSLILIHIDINSYSSLVSRLDDLLKQYMKYVKKENRR